MSGTFFGLSDVVTDGIPLAFVALGDSAPQSRPPSALLWRRQTAPAMRWRIFLGVRGGRLDEGRFDEGESPRTTQSVTFSISPTQ